MSSHRHSNSNRRHRSSRTARHETWSEWLENTEDGSYYRCRMKSDGTYEYDTRYVPGTNPETSTYGAGGHDTPRGSVDELANTLQGYNLNEPPEYGSRLDAAEETYTTTSNLEYSSSYGTRGKGKAEEEVEDDLTSAAFYGTFPTETGLSEHDESGPTKIAYEEDQDVSEIMEQHRLYGRDLGNGESSSSAQAYSAYAPEPSNTEALASGPRLAAQYPGFSVPGLEEGLDPRYVIMPSSSFQLGCVFKVFWSEPRGGHVDRAPSIMSETKLITNVLGEQFFTGIRRFIVIAGDEGHSTCVPILTYGNQGCKKRGLKPMKHGIIYSKESHKRPLDGEPKLGFRPIRLNITDGAEKLARSSRVNYSKLVSIEHNVKVWFIGYLSPDDFAIADSAVNKCWSDKVHRQRRQFGTN